MTAHATFYFTAEDGGDPIVFTEEATMKRALAYVKRGLPVARFLYQNRKAELALTASLLALGREIVQAATGH